MGTIGTYHYDDGTCARSNALLAELVAKVADECQTQGTGFADVYLDAMRDLIADELAARGDVTRARAVARSRILDVGPPH